MFTISGMYRIHLIQLFAHHVEASYACTPYDILYTDQPPWYLKNKRMGPLRVGNEARPTFSVQRSRYLRASIY